VPIAALMMMMLAANRGGSGRCAGNRRKRSRIRKT